MTSKDGLLGGSRRGQMPAERIGLPPTLTALGGCAGSIFGTEQDGSTKRVTRRNGRSLEGVTAKLGLAKGGQHAPSYRKTQTIRMRPGAKVCSKTRMAAE